MVKKTFVETILDTLVSNKALSAADADSLKYSFIERSKTAFLDYLVRENVVEQDDMLRALSVYYQVASFDVTGFFFQRSLLNLFPKDFLLRNVMIPKQVEGDVLEVVVQDPFQDGLENAIGKYVSYVIVFRVGLYRHIIDAVEEYYDSSLTEDLEIDDPYEHH